MYRGTVTDTDDPMGRGRVRVRIWGIHKEEDPNLPWAEIIAPPGGSGIGSFSPYKKGDAVWVDWEREGEMQLPLVFGAFLGHDGTSMSDVKKESSGLNAVAKMDGVVHSVITKNGETLVVNEKNQTTSITTVAGARIDVDGKSNVVSMSSGMSSIYIDGKTGSIGLTNGIAGLGLMGQYIITQGCVTAGAVLPLSAVVGGSGGISGGSGGSNNSNGTVSVGNDGNSNGTVNGNTTGNVTSNTTGPSNQTTPSGSPDNTQDTSIKTNVYILGDSIIFKLEENLKSLIQNDHIIGRPGIPFTNGYETVKRIVSPDGQKPKVFYLLGHDDVNVKDTNSEKLQEIAEITKDKHDLYLMTFYSKDGRYKNHNAAVKSLAGRYSHIKILDAEKELNDSLMQTDITPNEDGYDKIFDLIKTAALAT